MVVRLTELSPDPVRSLDKKIRIGEFRVSVTFKRGDQRLVVARIKRRDGAYTADDD